MSDQTYPKLVKGRWVASPLAHLGVYAARADRDGEPFVAVPRDLLLRVSRWQECGARQTFNSDEDGPLRKPVEVACRKEQAHDAKEAPDHVREHSNGYFTWPAEHPDAPAEDEEHDTAGPAQDGQQIEPGTLTDAEVAALLAPCQCGHTINDHGSLAACWRCDDEGQALACVTNFEALLAQRVADIVESRLTNLDNQPSPSTPTESGARDE